MSSADVVFKSMRPGVAYTRQDLSTMCKIDVDTVSYILKELTKAGLIDEDPPTKYVRGKKYTTRQGQLNL